MSIKRNIFVEHTGEEAKPEDVAKALDSVLAAQKLERKGDYKIERVRNHSRGSKLLLSFDVKTDADKPAEVKKPAVKK